MSAIKYVLRRDDYEWDDNLVYLNALTKACKIKNDRVKTRLPIQRGLLEVLLFEIQRKYRQTNQPYLELLYKSAFLLAYYGLLRVGELTSSPHVIKVTNVHEANNKSQLLLVLYSSKTHGRDSLPQKIRIKGMAALEVEDPVTEENQLKMQVSSKPKTRFCPVYYTLQYIKLRPGYEHKEEPFFIFQDGSPLTAQRLRKVLRQTLTDLNLQSNLYDTHSFRIGRATDLMKDKTPFETIKHMGRWKSDAVLKYLRD